MAISIRYFLFFVHALVTVSSRRAQGSIGDGNGAGQTHQVGYHAEQRRTRQQGDCGQLG